MARLTVIGTLGQALGTEGAYNSRAGGGADIAAAVSTTAVAADIATLVADGASPTQAHVTALNGHWTTLLAAITAQQATVAGDVLVSVDQAVITTPAKFQAVWKALLQGFRNSGML